jgi:hypothetical protein
MVAGGPVEPSCPFSSSIVSAQFPLAVGFFFSTSSGSLVELRFLVAAEVAVVRFFLGVLPGGLRRCVFHLPVRAQWV